YNKVLRNATPTTRRHEDREGPRQAHDIRLSGIVSYGEADRRLAAMARALLRNARFSEFFANLRLLPPVRGLSRSPVLFFARYNPVVDGGSRLPRGMVSSQRIFFASARRVAGRASFFVRRRSVMALKQLENLVLCVGSVNRGGRYGLERVSNPAKATPVSSPLHPRALLVMP